MTGLFSIIWRELAVGPRQKATYRARVIAAGIMIAVFMILLLFQSFPLEFLGPMLFGVTAGILFLQTLFSGVGLTADCLSEEKREGTLGLLYLSGLSGGEIVLGKMAVRSLRGFYALLAALPVFGFCILMGGVQGAAAFQTAIGLLATMTFSLAIGVLVSSRATDEKAAFAGTVALLAGVCILPGAVHWMILHFYPTATWADYLLWISPFNGSDRDYWKQFGFQILLTAGILAAAAFSLNASFRKQFAGVIPLLAPQKGFHRKRRSQKLIDSQPIDWLLSLDKFGPRIVKFHLVVTLATALFLAYVASQSIAPVNMGGVVILYGFHFAWKLLVAADALRRLHHDQRSGALELLLTTPLDPNSILKAQSEHTALVFLPAAFGLCIANFTLYLSFTQIENPIVVPIGGTLFLFLDGAALRSTVMLQAFQRTRFPAAVMRAMLKVVVLPLGLFWLVLMTGRGIGSAGFNGIFLGWFIVCGIYDAILIARAKQKLLNIRLLAANEVGSIEKERRPLPRPLQWLLLTEPVTEQPRSDP